MKVDEVRSKYLKFFKERGHAVIPSAQLVPEHDPTTLFTGSGMQPLLPYLLGTPHPLGQRIVNLQKCFRAEDIDDVGDSRHTTFFEMLGNWSFGDYFKSEQLRWLFEFLTEVIGLDAHRLYVTVFGGDPAFGLSKDVESADIWTTLFAEKGVPTDAVDLSTLEGASRLGMQGGRILFYGVDKNWWSRSGTPQNMPAGEPGGADSEVFYEFKEIPHETRFGIHCHPNCDCGRFLEIGNSVFMEYLKTAEGGFIKLPQRNVDFGGGLERLAAVSENRGDIFTTDVFFRLIRKIEELSGKSYNHGDQRRFFRLIADHIRAVTFIIAAGVSPSSTERGYVLRRLIRRAVRFADLLGLREGSLKLLPETVIDEYAKAYPELVGSQSKLKIELDREESRFRQTLRKGIKRLDMIGGDISAEEVFDLYQSYGFPVDLTAEIASERGWKADLEGTEALIEAHSKRSRSLGRGEFKGGLSGMSQREVRYHTATHLLGAALRLVLGNHVTQMGSNITPERLRFDFSHRGKLTRQELIHVEDFVNEKIREGLPVSFEVLSLEEARRRGAVGTFGQRYADVVKVYKIGGEEGGIASLEICGGPHVGNTQELGRFKIIREEGVSQGVRRIRAILEGD